MHPRRARSPSLNWTSFEIPEINATIVNPKSVLKGHTDYIHCLCFKEREEEILSGGEDGAVRIWTHGQIAQFTVLKFSNMRNVFGKWISCLATDSDWMLCGGGPSLSSWLHVPHLVFPLPGCQREAVFHQDLITSVGEGPYVSHCLHGGTMKAQIPCTPSSLNTLALNLKNTKHRVMTVGGSSHQLDVLSEL